VKRLSIESQLLYEHCKTEGRNQEDTTKNAFF